MPVTCRKIGKRFRILGPNGKIEKTKKGNAVDGGGHSTKAACGLQARAINANTQNVKHPFKKPFKRTEVVPSNPLKADPTRTKTLRDKFTREITKRFRKLKSAIIDLIVREDAFGLKGEPKNPFTRNEEREDGKFDAELFKQILVEHYPDFDSNSQVTGDNVGLRSGGLSDVAKANEAIGNSSRRDYDGIDFSVNQRFAFQSDPAKVESFRNWLQTQFSIIVPPRAGESLENQWWTRFVEEGYRKGAGRAFDDTQRARRALATTSEQLSFFEGTKEQFLQQSFGRAVAVEKVQLLAGRVFTELKGVTDAMAQSLTRELTQGLAQGDNPLTIARRISQSIENIPIRRARAIARTEIIRAHAEGQLDAMEQMGLEDVGVMVEWSTAGDDRVCFPKNTVIETEFGPQAIQSIELGARVWTRNGLQKVIASSSKLYSDELIKVKTKNSSVVSTKDHPFWTAKGWVEAKDLQVGNWVRDFESDKITQIRDVVNLGFRNSTYFPSSFKKIFGLFQIFFRVLMPIRSIDFKSDSQIRQEEIDAISSKCSFLDKLNLQFLKRFSNFLFNRCFSRVFSIARKTTKPLVSGPRAFTKFVPTIITDLVSWWSSAFFGTMLARQSSIFINLFMPKSLTTNTSNPISFSVFCLAFKRTVIESVGIILRNLKFLRTPNTNLEGHFCFVECEIASSTTEFSALSYSNDPSVNKSSTNGTRNFLSSSSVIGITRMRTKGSFTFNRSGSSLKRVFTKLADTFKRHRLRLQSRLGVFYHRLFSTRIIVYDLQIENIPEFFADGILVHNCPLCAPMEGTVLKIKEARGLIPRHTNCRCAHIPANVGESKKGQIRSKTAAEKSLRESIKAEIPKGSTRSIAAQRRLSKWPGADLKVAKKRPKGIV